MVDRVLTVGVLTPHVTPGPELEIPVMSSDQVVTLVSRISLPGEVGSIAGERLRRGALPPAVDGAAAVFAPGSVQALAYASTSSGYAIGFEAEGELVRRLQDRWALPVSSSSLAAVQALHAYGVRGVTVVHPPWFDDETDDLGAAYFRSQGLDAVVVRATALPGDPADVRPESVVEWADHHLDGHTDAVFFGGNGFRAAAAVERIERQTGRLVITANQVLLWSVLAAAGRPAAISAYGRLLREGLLPPAAAKS